MADNESCHHISSKEVYQCQDMIRQVPLELGQQKEAAEGSAGQRMRERDEEEERATADLERGEVFAEPMRDAGRGYREVNHKATTWNG